MLCKEALDEFKEIYLHEHGILLSDEETQEKAINVLNFVKLLTSDETYIEIEAKEDT